MSKEVRASTFVTEKFDVKHGDSKVDTVTLSLPEMIDTLISGNEVVIRDFGKFSRSNDENSTISFTPEVSFDSRISDAVREKYDLLHQLLSCSIFPGDMVAWIDGEKYWIAKVTGILRTPRVGLELVRPDGDGLPFTIDYHEGDPLYKVYGTRLMGEVCEEEDDE